MKTRQSAPAPRPTPQARPARPVLRACPTRLELLALPVCPTRLVVPVPACMALRVLLGSAPPQVPWLPE
ncbi:hypothetical protein ACWF0M_06390 [Kribbella sp. NPDC055110]